MKLIPAIHMLQHLLTLMAEREKEQGEILQHSPNNHPHRPRRRRNHPQQILLHRQRSTGSRRSNLCPISISISISISIAVCGITASAVEVRSRSNRVRGIFPLGIDVGAARGHCGEEEGDAEDGEAHCCGCLFFGWLVNYCVCVYVYVYDDDAHKCGLEELVAGGDRSWLIVCLIDGSDEAR